MIFYSRCNIHFLNVYFGLHNNINVVSFFSYIYCKTKAKIRYYDGALVGFLLPRIKRFWKKSKMKMYFLLYNYHLNYLCFSVHIF